jgi:hypothetical protein
MVKRYLSEEEVGRIYDAGFSSGCMEKDASVLDEIVGGAGDVIMSIPTAIASLLALGVGAGALSGVTYNIAKNRLSASASEKEDEMTKKTLLYNSKNKEMEDARWMNDVRDMKAELVKGMKKMTPEEYRTKYETLSRLIDERKVG